jgi:uncharacterized membrane protein
MIYAAMFGISKKVFKNLKEIYPNYESSSVYTYSVLDFSTSLSTNISSSSSDGFYSDGSGGFTSSGGGGGSFGDGSGGGSR